jgi:hypothetical protein
MTPSTMTVTVIRQRNFSAGILWTKNAAMEDERATLNDSARYCLLTVTEIPTSTFNNEVRVTRGSAS